MDSQPSIEKRVERLEVSLRRTRRVAAGLTVLLTVVASAAFARQEDEIRTGKLTLESSLLTSVSLVAGPESSLVIQDDSGNEILRIGGHPARLIGDDDG